MTSTAIATRADLRSAVNLFRMIADDELLNDATKKEVLELAARLEEAAGPAEPLDLSARVKDRHGEVWARVSDHPDTAVPWRCITDGESPASWEVLLDLSGPVTIQ